MSEDKKPSFRFVLDDDRTKAPSHNKPKSEPPRKPVEADPKPLPPKQPPKKSPWI